MAVEELDRITPLVLGIGVPKAATTWIHRQAEVHPEIGCTTTKEVGYWTTSYEKGPAWYVQQFPQDRPYRVYFEITPSYIRKMALERMASDLPDTRFVMSLRNPYERAFSEYLGLRRVGKESGRFIDVIKERPRSIIRYSQYGNILRRYTRHFSLDKLMIIYFEDVAADPSRVVRELYEFLGVDSAFIPPELETRVNVGRNFSTNDYLLKRMEGIAKRFGLKRSHLKALGLSAALDSCYRLLARRAPAPTMTSEDIEELDRHLRPDIEQLESILGRSFRHWLPENASLQEKRGR